MAKVYSINYSKNKGTPKVSINQGLLVTGLGLENDAHAGSGLRQVSLLSIESIRRQMSCPKVKKTGVSLKAGDFGENITTEGLDLAELKIGDKLKIGSEAILRISKIGKECHRYCSIYYKTGDCIMPREGIFAQVLGGGSVNKGDNIEALKDA